MEFNEIIHKALAIRSKYAELEKKKYAREWTREEIALGLVGDVGDLMKLVTAKEGVRNMEDINTKLAHELSDCLWAIIVLSSKYNIDLEKSFISTMNELNERLEKN